MPDDPDAEEAQAGRSLRARGRFTRNFVVQASAADWAIVLLAGLRRRLAAISPPNETGAHPAAHASDLVFFQHDEVIVHCPREEADLVAAAVLAAGEEARRLLFGDTEVRFPLDVSVVERYSDAK